MFEHGKHHDVIEVSIWKRQWRAQIPAHSLPAALYAVRNLIVEADTDCDAVGSVIEKSGLQTAA